MRAPETVKSVAPCFFVFFSLNKSVSSGERAEREVYEFSSCFSFLFCVIRLVSVREKGHHGENEWLF